MRVLFIALNYNWVIFVFIDVADMIIYTLQSVSCGVFASDNISITLFSLS